MSYLFALLSSLFFGISNAFWKTAGKQNVYPVLVLFRSILTSIIFGAIWIILNKIPHANYYLINPTTTLEQYLKTISLCCFCSFGLIFYLVSLDFTPVSISVPLSSINWFSILTAVFILHETFYSIYIVSILLSITGFLLAIAFDTATLSIKWNKGASYAVAASFFWGISYALFKVVLTWVGAIQLAFILELTVAIMSFAWIILKKPKVNKIFSKTNLTHYIILAILLVGGTLFFNLAVQKIPILIINFFGNFTLIVSILLGILFYKEKLTIKQVVGVVLLVIAIIILQFRPS